jgi:hypothetical protein
MMQDCAYLSASIVGCYDPVESFETKNLVLVKVREIFVVGIETGDRDGPVNIREFEGLELGKQGNKHITPETW